MPRLFLLCLIAGCTRAQTPASQPVAEEEEPSIERVYEEALSTHKRAVYFGDLDEIKRRRVLRMGLLNNAVSYFVHKGEAVGFQYELGKLLAQELGVRLEVVVPALPAQLPLLLEEGKVDVIATNEDEDAEISRTRAFSFADHVLVQPKDEPPVTSIDALRSQNVHVRATSAYRRTLEALGVPLVFASEDLETEELIDKVGKREIGLTVANSLLLDVERTYRDDVQGTLVLASKLPIFYGVRKDAPELLAKIDAFVAKTYRGTVYNVLAQKYFKNPKSHPAVTIATGGGLSPYDAMVKPLAAKYELDWRLVVAQMLRESRFDPNAKSWAGALGLLQMMPRTAAEVGLTNLRDPETGLHAGMKHMHRLVQRFDPNIDMRQRVRFALAAYNAGWGHIADARIIAKARGLDPDRWFGQVEQAMLLLEKPEIYRHTRHGFCRGREPVQYVSEIQSTYDTYVSNMKAVEP